MTTQRTITVDDGYEDERQEYGWEDESCDAIAVVESDEDAAGAGDVALVDGALAVGVAVEVAAAVVTLREVVEATFE